jgi:O-antigen/teichoic acid export membrane protein
MNFKLYLKNYFVHFLSIVTKFGTLLIITPIISKEKDYFTIYSYGISILAFLNYADLGFFRSAQKFASESVAQNNKSAIYNSLGFGTFISIVIVIFISIVFFLFSINPYYAISTIKTESQLQFAKYLFLTISLSAPLIIFQRMILAYYEINLSAYRFYVYSIIFNLVLLGLCLILLNLNQFTLLIYFILLQIFNLMLLTLLLFDLRFFFNYDLKSILFSIKFSKIEYFKTKDIALTSLVSMVSWLIFYEIDIVVLTRMFKLNEVAYYSLSLIILGLFRTFAGILFGTFNIRINNLIGNKDEVGFLNYCKSFLFVTAPIMMYITLSYFVISDYFILNWVGVSYLESSAISKYLVLGYSLSFISYITSSILLSKLRVKESFYISISQPIIFWLLIFLFYKNYSIILVAIIKFLILLVSDFVYLKYLIELTQITFKEILSKLFYPFIIIGFITILLLLFFVNNPPNFSNKINLLILAIYSFFIISLAILTHYKLSKTSLKFLNNKYFT